MGIVGEPAELRTATRLRGLTRVAVLALATFRVFSASVLAAMNAEARREYAGHPFRAVVVGVADGRGALAATEEFHALLAHLTLGVASALMMARGASRDEPCVSDEEDASHLRGREARDDGWRVVRGEGLRGHTLQLCDSRSTR